MAAHAVHYAVHYMTDISNLRLLLETIIPRRDERNTHSRPIETFRSLVCHDKHEAQHSTVPKPSRMTCTKDGSTLPVRATHVTQRKYLGKFDI